jgi:Gas vesicle synthesis protein GvpL/GvpF
MPLQVLGVVGQGHPGPAAGTEDGLGVLLVESGNLAAAVLPIADDTELTDEDAASHLDLLILLLRQGPVLPIAFGTVSPDEDAVRAEVLDAAAAELEERLAAVDGLVEARLDISYDESDAMREVMAGDARLRQLAAEGRDPKAGLDTRIALGEAVSSGLADWRRDRSDELLPTLAAVVHQVAELESSDPLQQRWAFLLPSERLGELDEAVGKLRSAVGKASVEYVGPLPVYSFLGEPRVEPSAQRSAWGW